MNISNAVRETLRRLAHETSASEIAEAAVVMPLMFMVILGVFWFGQAFSTYGAITRAAQEGARAGAAPYCATCPAGNFPAQNAFNAVQAALLASHLDLTKVPVLPSGEMPVLNSCIATQTSQVNCDTRVGAAVCVQVPVQLTSTIVNGGTAAGVCGVSVTFQYPFQFWLPFTSLNKQQVLLYASARVRMETR
jgi:Flp pilus assembly protein TadG